MINKTDIDTYNEALSHLIAAFDLMNGVTDTNPSDYDSIRYAQQIRDIIECDGGEAGLKPFVDQLNNR